MPAYLNDAQLRAFKAKEKDYIVRESTGQRGTGRLLVKIKTNGAKELYYQYQVDGKQKRVKLGNYSPNGASGVTLAEARKKAGAYGAIYSGGQDVQTYLADKKRRKEQERQEEQRRLEAERRSGSFGQLLDAYTAYLRANSRATADLVAWGFNKYIAAPFPQLLDKKAKELDSTHIRDILARMIHEGVTSYSNRIRSQLHAAFAFGLQNDNDPRHYSTIPVQFGLAFNPVAGVPVQADFERAANRYLSTDELRTFWLSLPGGVNPVIALLWKFLLAIGGQRPEQVLRCDWSRYDLERRTMTIENPKAKRGGGVLDHVVPLNDSAVALLQELLEISGHCRFPFPGRGMDTERAISIEAASRALAAHIKAANLKKFVMRDFRRTWKTLAGEAGISKLDRDLVQGHARHDVSAKHYDRYEYLVEKQRALVCWDTYLQEIIAGEPVQNDNVINLHRR